MKSFLQDLRVGARLLWRSKSFTAVAALTLALGIGANTAIFTLVNALLLKDMPFRDPDQLVAIEAHRESGDSGNVLVGYTDLLEWREQSEAFDEFAIYIGQSSTMIVDGEPLRALGHVADGRLFDLLGARAHLGRTLLPSDSKPGAAEVVVLRHGLWQRLFGSDPGVIGHTIEINRVPHEIVGVMPPDFYFYNREVEMWFALRPEPWMAGPGRWARGIGRIRAGSTIEQAQAEMNVVAQRIAQERPDTHGGWGVRLVPLRDTNVGELRPALLALLGAVGLVLLIACANVANLLVAKASGRAHEFGVRAALGAARGRLVRQALAESLVLGLLGGAGGLLLAVNAPQWIGALLPEHQTQTVPQLDSVRVDSAVLAFAMAVSLLATVLAGLFPALRLSKSKPVTALSAGGRAGIGSQESRSFRRILTVGETALAMVLLVGAGLLIQSASGLVNSELGFRPERVVTMRLRTPTATYDKAPKRTALYQPLLDRIEELPGVEAAAVINYLPLGGWTYIEDVLVEGRPLPSVNETPSSKFHTVSRHYFDAMGIPLIGGRTIERRDDIDAETVVVIGESFARQLFPNENPLGKRIRAGRADGGQPWSRIVES